MKLRQNSKVRWKQREQKMNDFLKFYFPHGFEKRGSREEIWEEFSYQIKRHTDKSEEGK